MGRHPVTNVPNIWAYSISLSQTISSKERKKLHSALQKICWRIFLPNHFKVQHSDICTIIYLICPPLTMLVKRTGVVWAKRKMTGLKTEKKENNDPKINGENTNRRNKKKEKGKERKVGRKSG